MTHRVQRSAPCRLLIPIIILLIAGQTGYASEPEVVTIEGIKVRGDQEMPTVMYLVPWQEPVVDGLEETDERLMMEPGHEGLDRYEFQRRVRYHQVFREQSERTSQGQSPD